MKKTILVTGGCGFIGSNFLKYSIKKYPDYLFINLDNLTYAGNLKNLTDIQNEKNYLFYKGDICDATFVDEIFTKHSVSHVINFAAESHVDRSIIGPMPFIKTNVEGTLTLLEIAKKHWTKETITANRFLQISTDEVYGSLGETGYFTETTNLSPNSPYSSSKASADLITLAYFKTYQFPVLITRCSNNYGPYQFPEKLIPLMIVNALNNKSLPVYGDGLNVRDWIHVSDHVKAIDTVFHRGRNGEIYNVGGNSEKTNISLVKDILKILKKDESLIQFVGDRLGHDRRYAIDGGKIKNELGFSPSYTFDVGLKETVAWYLENKDWCENDSIST